MIARVAAVLSLAMIGTVCLQACGSSGPPPPTPAVSLAPAPPLPVTRWDFRPEAERWTRAALTALDTHAAPLVAEVPADVATYCPAYPAADAQQRKAFWVGLISALAKHESTWRPDVSGGEGRWHGLLQIAPATAKGYGCQATTAEALKSGSANLACALRIMAVTVPRDGVIAEDRGGIAADWGPFTKAEKRAEMAAWTREQSYCQ